MATTVSIFDHTVSLFTTGTVKASDNHRFILCSSAIFNSSLTYLVDITYTELPAGNGYFPFGADLQNKTITTFGTNNAKFDADDLVWDVTGSGMAPAFGILYDNTLVSKAPLLFFDFGGTISVPAGSQFKIIWDTNGILNYIVT